jgi:hypothetical protein
MRRFMLIAAAAAITIQPMASLPIESAKRGHDRRGESIWRIAPAGCAVPVETVYGGAERTVRVPIGRRGTPNDIRRRSPRRMDRCTPSRGCLTDRAPLPFKIDLGNPLRTPTFLGK